MSVNMFCKLLQFYDAHFSVVEIEVFHPYHHYLKRTRCFIKHAEILLRLS
jgi:hypothetical protein